MLRALLCLPLVLAACQTLPPAEPAAPTAATEGRGFAEASCGSCHAIAGPGNSRNPSAPPFPVIVNRAGVTAETLTALLGGPHNHPSAMDFYLSQHEVDAIVAYMLTLRDADQRRRPD